MARMNFRRFSAQVLLRELQLRQLGDALDQFGDLAAEQLLDLLAGGVGILDHVMQQRRDDGLGVEPVVGEDARHLDGVGEIGIAGRPLLRAMLTHGVNIGAVQQRLVSGGVVRADLLDQLELTQHLGTRRSGRGGGRHRNVGRRGGRWTCRLLNEWFCAVWAQYRSS